MKRHLLIAEFASTPWALMPERLDAFAALLTRWSEGIPASTNALSAISADVQAREARRTTAAQASATSGSIAVLPLYGVITQRGNMAGDISGSGGTSTQQFAQSFRAAMADTSVAQILIDIDSPGGSVYGIQELATEIIAARATKPVIAIANSLCASAGYWLGCCASELYITPGGEVGSIGVWQAHEDRSQAIAESGVKRTYISAGKFKTEGNPDGPLSAETLAFMQSRVNDYFSSFTQAVATGRGVNIDAVRNGMGQGRVLGADAALAQNMVDGIATFDEVVQKMQRSIKSTANSRPPSRLAAMQREVATLT